MHRTTLWISRDEDNTWFDALDRATLNLIYQYAIMVVNLTKQDIYLVFLCNIFRTIQTFKSDDLILPFKNRLVICQSAGDLLSADLIVDIDSWLEPNTSTFLLSVSLIGSQKNTPSNIIHAYNNFVTIYINNKGNHIAASVMEEKELTIDLARETITLL